jgi:hypothetical protein
MHFQVSAEHVKRQNRKSVYLTIFLLLLSAGCVAAILNAESVSKKLFALIGLFIFAQAIYRAYKVRTEGDKSYPTLELDEKQAGATRIGIVTGPSLTSSTCMSAAKMPVCTMGCAVRAWATK